MIQLTKKTSTVQDRFLEFVNNMCCRGWKPQIIKNLNECITLITSTLCHNLLEHQTVQDSHIHPLGDVRVHHEVVNMFLCPGQLQLPCNHCHH